MNSEHATERMDGKVCLVTGGTSGIGGGISKALATRGATVVMVGRNAVKGQAAVEEVRQQTGNRSVGFLQADLMALASVRTMAREFQKRYDRLDVLVNNAGGSFWKREVTADGMERTLALNLLAPFLLTNLLLPVLERSTPSRVVNVATKLGDKVAIDFSDLQTERGYNAIKAYSRAKAGLMLFTYELARRVEQRGITANCVHPGVITSTDFGSDFPALFKAVGPFFAWLMGMRVSLEEGIETPVYLAASPEVASATGQYYIKKQAARSPRQTYDAEVARRLWDTCEALTADAAGLEATDTPRSAPSARRR